MSSIADDPAAELRELRRRAYGPGADIHDDAAAMARLHELENGVKAAPAPRPSATAPAAESESVPDPATQARVTIVDAPAEVPVDAEDAPGSGIPSPPDEAETPDAPPPTAERVPWWRRRMRLLWAASLVIAALIGAGVALSVQAVAAGQVAVLVQEPDGDWPETFWDPAPDGGQLFEPFYGLTVLTVPQDFGDGTTPSTECVYIVDDRNSFGSGGCSAGTFPAIASLLVTRDSPPDLRDRFSLGTALQFVHEGDRVRVYAAQPAPGDTP